MMSFMLSSSLSSRRIAHRAKLFLLVRSSAFLRFQPTYEELKPTRAQHRPGLTPRFQPSYEELKQIVPVTVGPSVKSFQPTYEELKLVIGSPP